MTKLDKIISELLFILSINVVCITLLAKLYGEWGTPLLIYAIGYALVIAFYLFVVLPLAYVRDLKAQRDEARMVARMVARDVYRMLIGARAANLIDLQFVGTALRALGANMAQLGDVDQESIRIISQLLPAIDRTREIVASELEKLDPMTGTAARMVLDAELACRRAKAGTAPTLWAPYGDASKPRH